MIKGVNHRIIEINEPAGRYFERAILFVRPGLDEVSERKPSSLAEGFTGSISRPPVSAVEKQAKKRRFKIKMRLHAALWCALGIAFCMLIRLIFGI